MNLSFGKLNADGSKAVYLTDINTKQRVFCFWYYPKSDNPYGLKPKQAVWDIIEKAGYTDCRDFFNQKLKQMGV